MVKTRLSQDILAFFLDYGLPLPYFKTHNDYLVKTLSYIGLTDCRIKIRARLGPCL